jgi:hypothetical protein
VGLKGTIAVVGLPYTAAKGSTNVNDISIPVPTAPFGVLDRISTPGTFRDSLFWAGV